MKSVIKNEYILVIKNSKFICRTYPITKEEEVKEHLKQAKIDYPNATHYCYAYILDNIRKESDDGEPSKTAGLPMLQVLEKNELNKSLCIVIRYFGKIKLGANGLIRAYTKVVTTCLEDHIIYLKKGYIVDISFPYSYSKKIDYILNNSKILKKNFEKIINYQTIISESQKNILENLSKEISIKILEETWIEDKK